MPDVNKFLTEMKANSSTDMAAKWALCEEHYNKKLWHQLTVMIQGIVKEPSMQDKLIHMYKEFIADFETRMDPLSLAFIANVVLERFTSPEEAMTFIVGVGEKVKMNNEAYAMTKVLQGRIKLHKYEQHKETKVYPFIEEKNLSAVILLILFYSNSSVKAKRQNLKEKKASKIPFNPRFEYL